MPRSSSSSSSGSDRSSHAGSPSRAKSPSPSKKDDDKKESAATAKSANTDDVKSRDDRRGRRRRDSSGSRRSRSSSRSSRSRSRSRSRSNGRGRGRDRDNYRRRRRSRSRSRSSSRSDSESRGRRGDGCRKAGDLRDVLNERKAQRGDGRGDVGRSRAPAEDRRPARDRPKKDEDVTLTTRTGGTYIPPARLRLMQTEVGDKESVAYQRMTWDALKKSINGLVNKVNIGNLRNIAVELFGENLVRGRGLFSRSLMRAQLASPTFTPVYAALLSVINTKFPQIGELVIKRLVLQYRRSFKRNDQATCIASAKFLAHLVNQHVAHEVVALQILTVLLERPTDDSVEVAVGFIKDIGQALTEDSPKGLAAIYDRLRAILHEGQIDKRVQYVIEVAFAVRKDGFKEHVRIPEGLDVVEDDDQITHLVSLDDETIAAEDVLDVFKADPEFQLNEERYRKIKAEILGDDLDSESGDGDGDESSGEDESEEEEAAESKPTTTEIIDETQTNNVNLRRTIYLTVMSSASFEECAHKLMKLSLKPGQEMEICSMIIECCSQERSYLSFYGLLAERFCRINRVYQENFDLCFQQQYNLIHRLETNRLRNVARLFAHVLYSDAMPWNMLSIIHLNEDETTSSSRIFIKILVQEMASAMGLPKLAERFKDPTMAEPFSGLFPKDNPRNTRFAINFFTSIGLGGLTDDLREHLKIAPKLIMAQKQQVESSDSDSSSSSSSSS
eukprot:Opistho-2@62099